MKIKEGATKRKPVKAREKHSSRALLEDLAKHELRVSLQEVLKSGQPTRYVGPNGFLWSELASTITRCLRLDISKDEFHRRMPASVEWLAQKLVAVCGWDLPLRASMTSDSIVYEKNPRQPVVTRTDRTPPSTAIQRLTDTLRDALGDLYGTGYRVRFITSTGKLDWRLLGELCGLSPQEAKQAATGSCREIVRELEDYVLSHRDPVERFIAESRLGLRRSETE